VWINISLPIMECNKIPMIMISLVPILLFIISQLQFAIGTSSNVNDLIDKGNSFYNLGNYQEAITYYDKALAIDPNNVYALNAKGVALGNLNKSQEAITYYDKALAIDPNNVYALNAKGVALGNLNKSQEAIT
jgi:tetratricopeptide (TPR) repeat protein